jgi:hypothetical protein
MRSYVNRAPDVQERPPLEDWEPLSGRELLIWACIMAVCAAGVAALYYWPQEAAPTRQEPTVQDKLIKLVRLNGRPT